MTIGKNGVGEPAERCPTCGGTNTRWIDVTTRECGKAPDGCGEYAVEHEGDPYLFVVERRKRDGALTGVWGAHESLADAEAQYAKLEGDTLRLRVEDETGCERIPGVTLDGPRVTSPQYRANELGQLAASFVRGLVLNDEAVIRTVIDRLMAEAAFLAELGEKDDERTMLDVIGAMLPAADRAAEKRKGK